MRQYRTVTQFQKDGKVFYGEWTTKENAKIARDRLLGPQANAVMGCDGEREVTLTYFNPYKCYIEERETGNGD